jgi:membrane protein YdbS with pleckstrin-like domain
MYMYPRSWQRRALEALALLLAIAIGAHLVWSLLGPLLPFLGAVVVLAVVYTVIFRGWRR